MRKAPKWFTRQLKSFDPRLFTIYYEPYKRWEIWRYKNNSPILEGQNYGATLFIMAIKGEPDLQVLQELYASDTSRCGTSRRAKGNAYKHVLAKEEEQRLKNEKEWEDDMMVASEAFVREVVG